METLTSMAFPIFVSGWNVTTFLKKSNRSSPDAVCGKYVTAVGRGQEMMLTRKIPMRIAPLIRYSINITVKILQTRAEIGM